jgi:hypothetical protein
MPGFAAVLPLRTRAKGADSRPMLNCKFFGPLGLFVEVYTRFVPLIYCYGHCPVQS